MLPKRGQGMESNITAPEQFSFMMAGNTRSAVSAKQPFNPFFGHTHNFDNFVQKDGNNNSNHEQNSAGFGSKYTQEFDSWNSFGAKFCQDRKNMLCFESELEEPVANGDNGIKFVNGFAAQMRHNAVATYSSDDSDKDCSLSTYEIDSNISSSPSHCSAKSCVKSTSSQEYCTDYTETDSRKSNASVQSNGSVSSSPSSLRMCSSTEAASAAHSSSAYNQNIDNNMAVAGSNRVSRAGNSAELVDSSPPDPQSKQMSDVNCNVREHDNCVLPSKVTCNVKTAQSEADICKTFHAEMHKATFTYRQHNSNLGLVQDWLDNSVDSVSSGLDHHQPKLLDGQRAKPSSILCKCCAEQDNKKSRAGKRFKKSGQHSRKFEYEVVKRENLIKKKVLNGHSKRKKDKLRNNFLGLDKRRMTIKTGKIETLQNKGSVRRKLALKRISETDAKKMIKELKRTLKRVSAEIEELKKLTRKPKKKNAKQMIRKKGGHNRPPDGCPTRKHIVKTHNEPHRYVPQERFIFQCAIPSPPSLTVRNGDLEPTFSMVIARGSVPPKKHPIWSWKLGNPPLPGTVISKRK